MIKNKTFLQNNLLILISFQHIENKYTEIKGSSHRKEQSAIRQRDEIDR
jgi:hypothetical protein